MRKVSGRDCFAGRVYFEGSMRDAIHSADPAREDWKRRVVEFASSEMFDRLFKEGMALVERLPGVEGVIVTAASEVRVSSGLRGKVVITKPPTP